MKKLANKSVFSHASAARQPGEAPVVSPHRPNAPPQSGQRSILGIPLPDPIKTVEPIHDDIARRAYEIYVEKGYPQGQSEQIWRQAELEQRFTDVSTLRTK